MQWIIDNWLTLVLIGGMLAMHLFGHGHGGHARRRSEDRRQAGESSASDAEDGVS